MVAALDVEGLRLQLIQSQEKLLIEAARFWEAERNLGGMVLDVGSGLGGSSIFLVQEYGAHVHALTNVPGHIRWISHFADIAGVSDKIKPILGDAYSIPGDQVYDSVIAIESSCYLDRRSWFSHLAQRVRRGGHVFIADCFTDSERVRVPFDRYWLTRIGTLDEYVNEGNKAGFGLEGILDLTSRTSRFWEFNILYSSRLLEAFTFDDREKKRLKRSIEWQTQLLEIWNSHEILCALLHFSH